MEASKPYIKWPKLYLPDTWCPPHLAGTEHIMMAEGILNMIEKDTTVGLDLTVPKRFIRHFLHPKHDDETREKRLQEANALLERFEYEDAENEARFTPHLWAVFQLAPIDQLEALLGDLRSGKITWKDMHKRVTMFLDDSLDSLFACKVLDLQAYDMSALKEVSEHLMSREAIWGSETVEKYREMLYNIGPEGAGNMVLRLCPRHRWDNAQYAFEPLEQTADSLRVRFRFLPDTRQKLGKERAHALVWDGNLARDPEEFLRHYPLERDYDHNICLVHVANNKTHELRDSQIIEIKSKIPGRRPEFLLWEMRYKTRLMVTMISAAQPETLEAYDVAYEYEGSETMSCTPG
ncbi:hypothetical protein K4K60_000560 [Colletotrichum sp. SAR11_57]|nr:hypothetical protein K4K60_000560 [Colletotrichum sp. SAR11_57]